MTNELLHDKTNEMACPSSFRSAWDFTQSDQSLHCPREESLGPQLPIERTAKTLIRLDGCPGWCWMHSHYAPNFEEVDGAYWFRVVYACMPVCVCPFVTLFDACHILWTLHTRVLKFHIWIPHGQIADPYFFSSPSFLPFWSYAPWKKSEWNLVGKISEKVFELGAWNLVNW